MAATFVQSSVLSAVILCSCSGHVTTTTFLIFDLDEYLPRTLKNYSDNCDGDCGHDSIRNLVSRAG